MKIAYFDCFAGAAGNMILGALINAGCNVKTLTMEINKIVPMDCRSIVEPQNFAALQKNTITIESVCKYGISGTYFDVVQTHEHHHRNLSDIIKIINKSKLKSKTKKISVKIFTELAKVEAKVHGTTINKIHFHEVGAVDAIIDIVGTVIALDLMKIEQVFCSPLPISHGTVKCAHGIFPVPAPATAELLKDLPTYKVNIKGEMITPTGAVILKTLSESFGDMPNMKTSNIGYGAGSKDMGLPPFLRVFIGESLKTKRNETVYLLETNIDDMNPQIYDYVIERLFDNKALDVWLENIQMKKNRPGQKLSVLCKQNDIKSLAEIILKETTAIGIRYSQYQRIIAERNIKPVSTKFGTIKLKESSLNGKIINSSLEYADCKKVAKKTGIPLKIILKGK